MTGVNPYPFVDRLIEAVINKKSHVVVGLDPHLKLLPDDISLCKSRKEVANKVRIFCTRIIEAVSDIAIAVKPQIAFFEQLGGAGYDTLEKVVETARKHGLLIISDSKRGDIGSTAEGYASYHLGGPMHTAESVWGSLDSDAMTVNAYMGNDSLLPFLQCVRQGKGVFVLAKTSNPSSADVQDLIVAGASGTKKVYEVVADLADRLGCSIMGNRGFSSVGLVVGATHPQDAVKLRHAYPRLYFLVPGYGAQGACASDVAGCFDAKGLGAIVNASRSILFAFRDPRFSNCAKWWHASIKAAEQMRDEINAALAKDQKLAW